MPANSPVISLRECRRLHSRKERRESGRFLVEGIRPVRAALDSGATIEALLHVPEALRDGFGAATVDLARARNIPCLPLTAQQFASISTRDNPRGIACVGKQSWTRLDDLDPETGTLVALHEPQDPGNLGTILRTCDAAGASGIVLIGDAVDPWHPAALRAAMGATFALSLAACSIEDFISWPGTRALQVVGTSDSAPIDYATCHYDDRYVLLMGSERQGLPPVLVDATSVMVRIPMAGRSDSLNLAVATSLVLYEARNQRIRRSGGERIAS